MLAARAARGQTPDPLICVTPLRGITDIATTQIDDYLSICNLRAMQEFLRVSRPPSGRLVRMLWPRTTPGVPLDRA